MIAKNKVINVAYADDHVMVRKGIIALIEDSTPIKVTAQADNGKQLLEILMQSETLPDACLIDINMPVMNGYELLVELKKRWPEFPCIVISAFAEEHVIIEFIKLGINGYIHKSSGPYEVNEAINAVLKDGYFYNHLFSESIAKNIAEVKQKSSMINEREVEFLKLICSDLSYGDIALKLGTTFKTIDGIRMRLCKKLGISSRIGLVIAAIRLGYYVIEPQYSNEYKSNN